MADSEVQNVTQIEWDQIPTRTPTVPKAVDQFLFLALTDAGCTEQWAASGSPPVAVFQDDKEHRMQRTLAEAIWEVWRRDHVLLTRQTYRAMLEAKQLGNMDVIAAEGTFNKMRTAVIGAKPADFPMLQRAVVGDYANHQRSALRKELAEAMLQDVKAPTQTTVERIASLSAELVKIHGDTSALPLAAPYDYETTDAGNAQLFADRYGKDCRYVTNWRSWIIFDGKRWVQDSGETVLGKAMELVRTEMYSIPPLIKDDEARGKYAKHIYASQSRNRIEAIVVLARPLLRIDANKLDTDADLFNVQNGTIDLKTGELRKHKREDFLTKLSPVTFDSAATCPNWDSFIGRIFQDTNGTTRANVVDYVQRAAGYALTGTTSEQCLFILYGNGANGKTTLVNALSLVVGDYAMRGQQSLLLQADRFKSNGEDEACLFGARLVCCDETNDGQRFDESKVKRLVGSGKIRARRLYENSWEFEPTHKIWLDCNHLPRINGTDMGIWRRIKPIPFLVTIPEAERDGKLADKLKTESSGILNWMLAGLKSWRESGLREPAEVLAAVKEYRAGEDVFGRFLGDCVNDNPAGTAMGGAVYSAYKDWCDGNGMNHPLTMPAFAKRLRERGYEKRDTNRGAMWSGLELKPTGTPVESDWSSE